MDYADYVLKKYSPKTEHNVSVRGGNDFVKYYASVGYYSEDGLVKKKAGYGFNPNNEYRRLSLRTNLDFQFTERLSASINIDGRFERRQGNNSPGDNQFFWKLYQAKPWSTVSTRTTVTSLPERTPIRRSSRCCSPEVTTPAIR